MPAVRAFARQIDIAKSQLLGPARRQLMVATAIAARDQALATDTAILGKAPVVTQIVDGREGAALESVKPGGTIVFLFAVGSPLLVQAFDLAIETAMRLSPVLTGRFRDSFRLLVNGAQRDAAAEGAVIQFAPGDEISITNLQPYSRKLEKGASQQAPNGVFEATAAVVRARFGGVVNVGFSYQQYAGFGAGSTRGGGRPTRRADVRRSELFPTITLALK